MLTRSSGGAEVGAGAGVGVALGLGLGQPCGLGSLLEGKQQPQNYSEPVGQLGPNWIS